MNLNPRSPCGLRRPLEGLSRTWKGFQSTQPEWAATVTEGMGARTLGFQSTQPEWAATYKDARVDMKILISIHAARVGCDDIFDVVIFHKIISIHAARVGCDLVIFRTCINWQSFQSTQPEWAATRTRKNCVGGR